MKNKISKEKIIKKGRKEIKRKSLEWWVNFMIGLVTVGLDRGYELSNEKNKNIKRQFVGEEAVRVVDEFINKLKETIKKEL